MARVMGRPVAHLPAPLCYPRGQMSVSVVLPGTLTALCGLIWLMPFGPASPRQAGPGPGTVSEPVALDFRVLGADGDLVADLTADEVTLRIDGRRRPVQSLRLVRVRNDRGTEPAPTRLTPVRHERAGGPQSAGQDPRHCRRGRIAAGWAGTADARSGRDAAQRAHAARPHRHRDDAARRAASGLHL